MSINICPSDWLNVEPIDTIKELKESKSGATMKKFLSAAPATPTVDDDGLTTFEFGPHTIRDGQQQRKEAVSALI